MADTTPKPQTVGAIADAADGVAVMRPDGTTVEVEGSGYVLDVPGVFVIDGTEVTAK